MVRVIAIIQARPGLRAQVLEAQRANLAAVLDIEERADEVKVPVLKAAG